MNTDNKYAKMREISDWFEEFEDDFLKFDEIPEDQRPSNRPDLCAFLLLDKLCPSDIKMDMVSAAEHDEIYLAVSIEDLVDKVTKEDILYLVRCGVRDGDCGLCMFV